MLISWRIVSCLVTGLSYSQDVVPKKQKTMLLNKYFGGLFRKMNLV